VVRFYEKALKAQKSILNLEKDALDPFKALEYEFSERLCQTQIRFFIGLHYAKSKYPNFLFFPKGAALFLPPDINA
jgi:hypothetical protein